MVIPYLALLGLIAIQRLDELRRSRRNAAWAFAHGGVEFGRWQLLVMAPLHTALLVGAGVEVVALDRPFQPVIGVSMFVAVIACQGIRFWTMRALGRCWNTRVIVVPQMVPVTSGPYRWLRHPNYLAVIVEGIAIPMMHDAWITAIAFSSANAVLLWLRIRCEEQALSLSTDYREAMADRGSLLPMRRAPFRSAAVPLRKWRTAAASDGADK